MITEIHLENFKCFRQMRLRTTPITVLIGVNGTGKSSTVQALLFLKQSLGQSHLVTDGMYLRTGKYIDIVFRGERSLKIGLSGVAENTPALNYLIPEQHSLPYRYEVEFLDGRLERQVGDLRLKRGSLNLEFARGQARRQTKLRLKPEDLEHTIDASNTVGSPLHYSGSSGGADAEAVALSTAAVQELLQVYDHEIRSIYLIPAIRGFGMHDYPLGDEGTLDLGTSDSSEVRAEKLATTLAYKRTLEGILSNWFKRITGITVQFPVVAPRRAFVSAGIGQPTSTMVNEGFGSNQLTFALTQLAISPNYSTICYEEPEIHLHPQAQSELVNVLIEVSKQQNKQVIITTHSEHILFGFLSNVAEGNLLTSDLSIWYFSRKNHQVENPQALAIDEKGRVESGLPGFFEVELEELERYFKALQKKE